MTQSIRLAIALLLLSVSPLFADDPQVGQHPAHLEKHDGEITLQCDYLLFLPADYAKQPKKWPLLLFLHGSGERGANLDQVKLHGPPKIVETRPDFPFILVSPQCPAGKWWSMDVLTALLDEIQAKYSVDPDRVYLTGLSMGGFGTWALAAEHPERFAAIAPMCGGGDPKTAARLKSLPVWVFHGEKDPAVPIAKSEAMVEALKAVGNDAKFTRYPDVGHDCWTQSYANPALYDWLLAHRRGEAGPQTKAVER